MMREMESEKLFQFRVKFEFTSSSHASQECAPRKLVTHLRPLRIYLMGCLRTSIIMWKVECFSFGCCKPKQTIQFFMNECVSATVDVCLFFSWWCLWQIMTTLLRWKVKYKNQVTLDSQLKPVNYEFKINWYRSDKRGRRDMTHLLLLFL